MKAGYFYNKAAELDIRKHPSGPQLLLSGIEKCVKHKYNSFNTALHQFKRPLISNLGQLQKHAYLSQIVISMDYYLYNNHDFDHGISKWNGTKRSVH